MSDRLTDAELSDDCVGRISKIQIVLAKTAKERDALRIDRRALQANLQDARADLTALRAQVLRMPEPVSFNAYGDSECAYCGHNEYHVPRHAPDCAYTVLRGMAEVGAE